MSRRPAPSTVLTGAGAVLVLLVVLLVVLATGGREREETGALDPRELPPASDPTLPPPDGSLPAGAQELAAQLTRVTRRLKAEIEEYTDSGAQVREGLPEEIQLLALRQQRIYFRISPRAELGDQTVALLPDDLRAEARNILGARRALRVIPETPPDPDDPPPRIRVGEPRPPGQLRRFYTQAERRFGVQWELLAAVNFVESTFGRLRNASSAGAQGPMQFIPSTWESYGMGGDIEDPRDAILGAANYLTASGAPADPRGALFAYNRSTAYGTAVLRHARAIELDPRNFYALFGWQVFVADEDGDVRRLTGPGR